MIGAKAPGKINLVFQVAGLDSTGYHEVRSVYQALDLFEEVFVTPSEDWVVTVVADLPQVESVPLDKTNLVVKAALQLAKHVGIDNPKPMKFEIHKQIPIAGGMAGGSADAAAALVALNEAWCLDLDTDELMKVASKVGADVPFCILGGTALGTGNGSHLTPLAPNKELNVVLVFSEHGLSTKTVFEKFDELYPSGQLLSEDLDTSYPDKIGENSLLDAALALQPELKGTLELDLGISGGFLSGSGPTVWFYSESHEQAALAHKSAIQMGFQALLTKTSSIGSGVI